MDDKLRNDMNDTIEDGKTETDAMRSEVKTRADEARADIDARSDQAEGEVREHFSEVRGEAADELRSGQDEADQLGSSVEREREDAEDRLVQMLDKARDRQDARGSQGFFDRIKSMFTGGD
jgi:F0F1-type ATP synthase membrane subunit b/b'